MPGHANTANRCNAQDAARWSQAELDALEPYIEYDITRSEVAKLLPGRNLHAITCRAAAIRKQRGIERRMNRVKRSTQYGEHGYDQAYNNFYNATAAASAALLAAQGGRMWA